MLWSMYTKWYGWEIVYVYIINTISSSQTRTCFPDHLIIMLFVERATTLPHTKQPYIWTKDYLTLIDDENWMDIINFGPCFLMVCLYRCISYLNRTKTKYQSIEKFSLFNKGKLYRCTYIHTYIFLKVAGCGMLLWWPVLTPTMAMMMIKLL